MVMTRMVWDFNSPLSIDIISPFAKERTSWFRAENNE